MKDKGANGEYSVEVRVGGLVVFGIIAVLFLCASITAVMVFGFPYWTVLPIFLLFLIIWFGAKRLSKRG